MKQKLIKIINLLLSKKGYTLMKQYEIDHINNKYDELIRDSSALFHQHIFKDLKTKSNRVSLLSKLYGTSVFESFYLIYYLQKSLDINGDVCEFGIANGATSALLAHEIKDTGKNLWLFDSFEGLSKPTKEDELLNDILNLGSMDRYEGSMKYSVNEVEKRLLAVNFPKSRTKIVKGFIEKSVMKKNLLNNVCFAFIDFDLYLPIYTALNYLDKKLSKGGFVIVDDYNFFSKGAKTAVDEFIKKNSKKYRMIMPYRFAGNFCILQKII